MLIACCIPASNEESTIASVIVRAMKYVNHIFVCDDGSTDLTGEIAKQLGAEVVRHDHNMGYGAALASLFERAITKGVDVVVTLDADGQHNPDDIPRLVEPILRGETDIVVGSRFLDSEADESPRYRKYGVKAITGLSDRVSKIPLTDAQCGFRAYNRRALALVKPSEMGMGASTEILLKASDGGLRVKEIPVKTKYDMKSHGLNPIYHGVDVVLSTVKQWSIRHPLLFYGVPGFASLVVAAFFWFWSLDTFVRTKAIITNVTLMAVASTLVGLILLTTGIIFWIMVSVIRER